MTDILQAAQQQINDAAQKADTVKVANDPPTLNKKSVSVGPTPYSGSAVGQAEPPLPAPKPAAPVPLPNVPTGSSLDLTSKTEPIQSPPLPIPPPDIPVSSGGWSESKAKQKTESASDIPIANIPQYDNKPSLGGAELPKPPPLEIKTQKFPDIPLPPPITPSVGSAANAIPGVPQSTEVVVSSHTSPTKPSKKKSAGRGILLVALLIIAAAIPLGVYYVTNQERFTQLQSQAVGDLRYLCTPNACATGGCNNPCSANLAGTNITWNGNAYIVPGNGYAIKNKCFGVESGATNRACSCPIANITDPTGSGDTCNLPDVERYFVRGPATLGWDENYCGTQQVDITVGSGNPSYFHTKEDTRPETCSAPSPTNTPAPQCDNGALFKVYDATGTHDISADLENGLVSLKPGDTVIVATNKVTGADHARFRLQGYGDWINSTDDTGTEFRTSITLPANFSGTNGTFEADICADSTSANCR